MRRFKRIKKRTVILIVLVIVTIAAVWFVRSGRWQRIVDRYERSETVILDGVEEFSKKPEYPAVGECAGLYILLKYYGVDVTVDAIIEELPKGPVPYEQDGEYYGGNPEREFIGSPYDGGAYGVFNQPIAEVAEKFKAGAVTTVGATVEDIIEIIDSGSPVLAWYASASGFDTGYRRSWLDYNTGEKVYWPTGEQAAVIYGHDGLNTFYVSDPNSGDKHTVSIKQFKDAFAQVGGRIVFYGSSQ